MSTFNTSMFQSIKDALASSDSKGSATFNEIMQTKVGNTFTVRLLPFAKDPSKTFFHYYNHGWNSFATGQYVQTLSPQTFGERDPIAEERFKVLRTGSDEEKVEMLIEIAMGWCVVIMSACQRIRRKGYLELISIEAHVVDGIHFTHQGKITVELVGHIDHMANMPHLFGGQGRVIRRVRFRAQRRNRNP